MVDAVTGRVTVANVALSRALQLTPADTAFIDGLLADIRSGHCSDGEWRERGKGMTERRKGGNRETDRDKQK